MSGRREPDASSTIPTARFLQARITALSTTCIKRLENIFAAALDTDHSSFRASGTSDEEAKPSPTLAETAVMQLQLDVESTALIRAVEDFMVLTRTMKELWLFGDLNTIPQETDQDIEMRKQMEADEKLVVQGFLDLLAKAEIVNDLNTNGTHADGAGEWKTEQATTF